MPSKNKQPVEERPHIYILMYQTFPVYTSKFLMMSKTTILYKWGAMSRENYSSRAL